MRQPLTHSQLMPLDRVYEDDEDLIDGEEAPPAQDGQEASPAQDDEEAPPAQDGEA